MPKNKIGGSGHKKSKRGNRNKVGVFDEESGDYYGKVIQVTDNIATVQLHDGRENKVIIPGKYFKKVWLKKEDFIVCDENEMKWKVESEKEKTSAQKLISLHGGGDKLFSNVAEEESDDEDNGYSDYNNFMSSKKSTSKSSTDEKEEDEEGDVDIDEI